MSSFVLGSAIGILLALLNFFVSTFYSSKIISHFQTTSVALAVIGLMGRLTLISIVFYLLSRIKWIHFQASLITFVIFFTVFTIWKAFRIYRETKPLIKQQTEI